jgi:hypothetical protein
VSEYRRSQQECEARTRLAFVPTELRGMSRTHDGVVYRRTPNAFIDVKGERVQFGGTLRRVIPKVRGKAARRADKLARRRHA